ncbi:MAG: hypothetical protein D6732_12430 [Methanobacteriota archaeon]|nr:MAG: hypothetical protein D6732_12430 [Euryarchaeota archaeon]
MFHRAVTRLKHSAMLLLFPIYFFFVGGILVALPLWRRFFVVAMHLLILILLTYLNLLIRHRKFLIRFTKGKVPAYVPKSFLDEVTDQRTLPDDYAQLYYLDIDSNLPIRIENFIRFKVLTYVKQRFGLYTFKPLGDGTDWEFRVKLIELPKRFDVFFEEFRDIFVHERHSQGLPLIGKYGFAIPDNGPKSLIVIYYLVFIILSYFSEFGSIEYLLSYVQSTILFYLLFALVDFVTDRWAFSHYFSEKGVVLDDRSP